MAAEVLPCSTEEGMIDAVSSHPVVALESSSFVVEDKETCCTDFVEIAEEEELPPRQWWPVVRDETAMEKAVHSPP